LKKLSKNLDELPKKISEETKMTPKSEKYFMFVLIGSLLFVFGSVLPMTNKLKKY